MVTLEEKCPVCSGDNVFKCNRKHELTGQYEQLMWCEDCDHEWEVKQEIKE